MRASTYLNLLTVLLLPVAAASADVVVNYTVDVGGQYSGPLNGVATRGTFAVSGDQLTILLENTSTSVPGSFDTSDSLLVSVAMNFTDGVAISAGGGAVIGPGSHGLGTWSDRLAGDSVAEQWIWTNDFGGDLLEAYAQVISTSSGIGDGTVTRFDGNPGNVGGPFGGIAADPPALGVPDNQYAVSDSILFTLTLSSSLTEQQLADIALASVVEFGSDRLYLGVPEPSGVVPALAGLLYLTWRRR